MGIKTVKKFLHLAKALLAGATLFHLLTYIPSLRTSSSILTLVLAIGIFPTFAASIIAGNNQYKGDWTKVLQSPAPLWWNRSYTFVLAYIIFNFFFSLVVLNKGGLHPEIRGEAFVLANKGVVEEVLTEEQYFKHKAYLFRAFSGFFIFFQFISVGMLSTVLAMHKEQGNRSGSVLK